MAEDPEGFVRVQDQDTGHEYTIRRRSVGETQKILSGVDAVDVGGMPIPPKHNPEPGPVKGNARPATSEEKKG